jgi:hypothetical protein
MRGVYSSRIGQTLSRQGVESMDALEVQISEFPYDMMRHPVAVLDLVEDDTGWRGKMIVPNNPMMRFKIEQEKKYKIHFKDGKKITIQVIKIVQNEAFFNGVSTT